MWSYYGSKSKIINIYPPPLYDKVIEPFAGSARYALRFWQRDILLVDKYDVIVGLWKWLQQCNENDILKLPDFKRGDDLRNFNLSPEERWLMGFCIGRGNMIPRNKGGDFNNWSEDRIRIAKNLFKIRHWEIRKGSYLDIEDMQATWFIDPPYQFGGHKYKHSNKNIDFGSLATWCKSRKGQSIVCENTKADWLPFKAMSKMVGAQETTTEAIWSNLQTNFDWQQTTLF